MNQVLLADVWGTSPARDNAIAYAMLFGSTGQEQCILGVMADYSATVSAIKTITFKTGTDLSKTGILESAALGIASTDTKVASGAFQYAIASGAGAPTMYQRAAIATGTTLAAGTIPQDKWGLYLFSLNAAGTVACTAAAANFTTGYATEALAIAALPATPSASASMGYVTVQTKTGTTFVGGTDSLTGGASGNIANATNYTNTATILPTTTIGHVIRWDFTNGPCYLPLPSSMRGGRDSSVSVELAASGTGGTTGRVTIFGWSK